MDRQVDKYKNKKNITIEINNCSTVYLSENILHFCCILCCMEDWWNTSTTLTECWSDTWPSELLRLLAEWCDSRWWAWVQWWTTWLVGEHWSEEHGGLGDSLLASHFEVLFNKELTSQAVLSLALWKCPLMNFLCVFFVVLFCSESVHEYYGNRRQARRERWLLFDPQAGNALLIQSGHKQLWWGSWNYSRIVFFFFII